VKHSRQNTPAVVLRAWQADEAKKTTGVDFAGKSDSPANPVNSVRDGS
jgi:hypothetical protein